jgi:hypothetical protein
LHEDRNRKRRPVAGLVPADLATDLVFAKANEDIEAALELLGEVGRSRTSDCTLANSGRGCNRIAKLLKRLMSYGGSSPQASIFA